MVTEMKMLKFIRSYTFKECIKILTVGWSIGFTGLICYLWLLAFLYGGKVIVNVNAIGEMYFELVLGIVFMPVMIYGYGLILEELASRNRKRKMRKSAVWPIVVKMETL